ncbi:ComEC/Rec2 family competence protein [Variovorax sp. 770b2]|uniref:ComEC/Rec2 family competence protein n=1 Tax=Variovorax sp. 770b2 TaxID=1566271 RepID=UPI0008E2FCFE|nr:MBL fold metallo-hydrolase [Variovorax sp. 770b2]SFP30942.1 Beta-lactamase superfamily domain-containing protein [Variovorax sp. 770b2]
MGTKYVINVDLADIWAAPDRKKLLRTIAWGDEIAVTKITSAAIEVEAVVYVAQPEGSVVTEKTTGYIVPRKGMKIKPADVVVKPAQNDVLRVNFVDVQQGDGAVIESPDGKVILVDGGDNQMFARYLAGRFRNTSAAKPKDIDCILVTHGDADHFAGLVEIFKSEEHSEPRKRLFMRPHRVFHNGIVKRPSKKNKKTVPDRELLGATRETADGLYITGLEDNLLKVTDAQMNEPFLEWKTALAQYNKRQKIDFRRLQFGDDKAFEFFNDGALNIEVLGPNTVQVAGKPALKFLGKPPEGPRIGHESLEDTDLRSSGASASHTINGHSVVFKLNYGGFSYLFCGDLNDEASRFLARESNKGTINLRSEIFKVPHHGSADFSGAFVQAVSPIVSVVSSGDESARKEYIHPRATLMGALGKYSRVPEPLVLVTELVAFFTYEGAVLPADPRKAQKRGAFIGFSRAAFGMVKTRTNGSRLLVYTDSANVELKEAYAYELDESGQPQPAPVIRV